MTILTENNSTGGSGGSAGGIGGPVNYDYGKYIKPPAEIGMSSGSSMNNIGDNIAGILSYIRMLVNGGGSASRVNGPMGPKFFIQTPGVNCKDIDDDKLKPRSLYLNYVPTGTLPASFVMPGLPGVATDYRGLLPGILTNIGSLNPVQMMNKIMTETRNSCKEVTMETIDANNISRPGKGFVSLSDIRQMDAKWFSAAYPRPNIPTLDEEEEEEEEATASASPPPEGFKTCGSNYNNNNNNNVFSSVSNVNFNKVNKLPPIYFNLLSLIGIYIMLKIMLGGRIH